MITPSPAPAPSNLQPETFNLQPPHPVLDLPAPEPWPEPVDGCALLDSLAAQLRRFVVLPQWVPETLALWTLHTYAFHLREVSTYIGVESPEKRCGKTTLLTLLSELVSRPLVASNISSPAFFRVIEEACPTLLIDEADTFLHGNDELRGILNSGYKRKSAFVVRVAPQSPAEDSSTSPPRWMVPEIDAPPSSPQEHRAGVPAWSLNENGNAPSPLRPSSATRLVRFSCWCPKIIAAIGRFPDTLADRCILVRMQRKTAQEQCERLRNLEPSVSGPPGA